MSRSLLNACGWALLAVLVCPAELAVLAEGQVDWPRAQPPGLKSKPSYFEVDNLLGSQGKVVLEVFPGEQKDLDDLSGPPRPAKMCIAKSPLHSCYVARARDTNFAQEARASVVDLGEGRAGILFQANYVGINDAWKLVAILGLDFHGRLINLLPVVVISMQDHFRVWHEPQLSTADLITAANYVWKLQPPHEETHFASHHYQISTYAFCANTGRYLLVDRFTTRRKFNGLDGENHPGERVLNATLPQVQSRLLEDSGSRKNTCRKLDEK